MFHEPSRLVSVRRRFRFNIVIAGPIPGVPQGQKRTEGTIGAFLYNNDRRRNLERKCRGDLRRRRSVLDHHTGDDRARRRKDFEFPHPWQTGVKG